MPTATTNATEQITITLPKAIAQEVRAKVASGEFATESDVIRESILRFVDQTEGPYGMSGQDFEDWIRAEALPVLEELDANPSLGLSLEQVRAHLAETHKNFQKAG
jgi:antitoxin ParD1/3/4